MLRFFVQLLVVLGVCKGVGWFGQRFLGQTQVVMEMLAGVFLGPSLFGLLAPKLQAWLFPLNATYLVNGIPQTARHPSMFILYVAAQLGLVFYMFLVGLEFNTSILKDRAKGAIMVSAAGVVFPFLLGAGIALFTHVGFGLFAPKIDTGTACLYIGAAMCITAFPMLARIIVERGIAGTGMGTLALGAGAAGDVFAWGILAVVLAFANGAWTYAAYAIGGGLLFGFLMLKYAARLFARLGATVEREGKMSSSVFASAIILLFVGALITDAIGIYAVFGAFIVGVTMPRGLFVEELRRKLESVTVGVLLPFFFVYSGLSTKVGLIDSPRLWLVAIVVVLAASLGKGVACAVAARASGEGWRESWAIGVLMNARGLMELIIVNIGLQQGVITPRLYTILVIMAIVTTLLASPIFKWIHGKYLGHLVEEARLHPGYRVVASELG
ncbi:MAG: cation:proton antiporter [Fimbriimonadaceae bacterium]